MNGAPLSKEEGAVKESVIKLNYIFPVSNLIVEKVLFKLNKEKRMKVYQELNDELSDLKG